jgi:hypothetical protein
MRRISTVKFSIAAASITVVGLLASPLGVVAAYGWR